MARGKKAVKKVAKRAVKSAKAVHTIVVGHKKRNDVFTKVRVPTALLDTLKCLGNKDGEVRISENQFYDAMHGFQKTSDTNHSIHVEIGSKLDRIIADGGQPPGVRIEAASLRTTNLREEAKAKSVLIEAQDIIFGDREQTYGAPDANLLSIGELWTVYLRRKRAVQGNDHITPDDVAQMMILLKTGRLINQPMHRDSLVDQAGYAALQQRIHDECPF